MPRLPRVSGCTVFLVAAILISAVACFGQSGNNDNLSRTLNFRIPDSEPAGDNFVAALCEAARVFHIPMGIAWIDNPAAREPVSLHLSNVTVLEMLSAIAHTQPNYEVRVSNGVVHVETTEVVPAKNFLFATLPNFNDHGVANEVKASLWMFVNQIVSPDPRRGYGFDILSNPDDQRIDLHFSNAMVETILDDIALKSENNIWIVTFEDSFDLTPAGFRRTRDWNETASPTPNGQQPIWDMFRWTYWPVHLVPSSVAP